MENQNEKLCKICNCSSLHNKFNGRQCIKCKSKKNNEKLKMKDYYKDYWEKKKVPNAKRGRPIGSLKKSIIEKQNQNIN